SGGEQSGEQSVLPAACAKPDCASRWLSRTSTSAPTAASTVLSSSSWPAANGSASIIIFALSARPVVRNTRRLLAVPIGYTWPRTDRFAAVLMAFCADADGPLPVRNDFVFGKQFWQCSA